MDTYQVVTTVISILALVVSVVSIVVNLYQRKKILGLQYAGSELAIRQSISDARNRVDDISLKTAELIASLPDDEKKKIISMSFESAVENNLNAYEEACMKYLDDKIDRERFQKSFQNELRRISENEQYSKYLQKPGTRFYAILAVLEEWENKERKK